MPLSVLQDKVDVKELNTSKNCQYALYSIIWGLARKDCQTTDVSQAFKQILFVT
jgi:hypothetical protein